MKKKQNIIITIMCLVLILSAGCATKEDNSLKDTSEIVLSGDIGEYMDYVDKTVEGFEPYYNIVFAFENLPKGFLDFPSSDIQDMYEDIRKTFDYDIVSTQPLSYRGTYTGDKCYVDGYDAEKDNSKECINVASYDYDGNQYTETPLKTVMLGEDTFGKFDDKIQIGRNLQKEDFLLNSRTDKIKVVLGNNYINTYKIGDVIKLDLVAYPMSFEVVGFYKPNVSLKMDVAAQKKVEFDNAIIIPHLFFNYEPEGEDERFQHIFLTGEKISGFIKIEEDINDIDEKTFERYEDQMKNIAEKYELSDLYVMPYRPVGFVWDSNVQYNE